MGKSKKNGGKKSGARKGGNGKKPQSAALNPVEQPAPKPAGEAAKAAMAALKSDPAKALVNAKSAAFAADFSQSVAVLMRAPNYKTLRISDLEWLVIPALLAGQSQVALSRFTKDGPVVPVALALWARVSSAVDKRLSENLDKPPVLSAGEWTSGDIYWLIVLAGEPDALKNFLPHLRQSVFKGRDVKLRVQQADGKSAVKTLKAEAPAKA